MAWAEIILLLLRIANSIVNQVNASTLMKAGAAEEIAKVSSAISARVAEAKAIQESVGAQTDAQVDTGLKELEPK